MSECCKECGGLRPHRKATLEKIEDVMKSIKLRPGSADCDVNPLNVQGKEWAKAQRLLEQAHAAVGEFFDALGAHDEN